MKDLNLEKALSVRPKLFINDDERNPFMNQPDLVDTSENLIKVVAGKMDNIIERQMLNDNEQ